MCSTGYPLNYATTSKKILNISAFASNDLLHKIVIVYTYVVILGGQLYFICKRKIVKCDF